MASRSALALVIVLLGAAGCGRTELFGKRTRCAPTDTVCQSQLDGGADGLPTIDGGPDGNPNVDGKPDADGKPNPDVRPDADGGPDGAPDMRPDVPVPCTAMLESCGNAKDDNCNGLVDCLDPLCFGDMRCVKPGVEVCNNTLDDDDDGKVDCADPDCMGNVACMVTMGPEICDNGKDDNGNKLVDCADPQCTKFPACLTLVCAADVDFGTIAAHGASVFRAYDTRGATQSFSTCATPGGNGRVGRFVLTETADVRMDIGQEAGAAHAVQLFRAGASQACDRNPVACVNIGDKPTATQTFAALPPGTYWLIAQSYPGTQGGLKITLSTGTLTTPEMCANGKDDDGNGLVDCQDAACKAAPNCADVECKPDGTLGALVVGAPPKNVRVDLTRAPNRYKPPCAGNMPSGGDAAIAFTLPEAAGIEVQFNQSGRTIFALYRQPDPGFACDDGDAHQTCSFEDDRAGAVAFSSQPAGRYLFIFKATQAGDEGVLNLRISAFGNRREEVCGNNIDDDGNGLTDCDDPTCFGIGMCGAPSCTPDVNLGGFDWGTTKQTMVDTRDAPDLYQTTCGKGNGRERIIRLSLKQPMALGIDCMGSGSHVLQLSQQLAPLDKCDESNPMCADPEVLPFGCGFSIPGLQPGDYNLIVEAFQAGTEGSVSLSLTGIREIIREICEDGVDNDNDGAVDCMDKKCVTSATCEKFACRTDKALGLLPLDGMVASAVVGTAGAGDDQSQTVCASAAGGLDGVVDFQLPAKADVLLEWAQVGNHDFALYSDDGPLLSCEAGTRFTCLTTGGVATGSKTIPSLPAGRYHLIIDADKPGTEGGVVIQLSAKAAP